MTWCVFESELGAVHFFFRTVRLCPHCIPIDSQQNGQTWLGIDRLLCNGGCCAVLPSQNGNRQVTKFYSLPTASEMSLVTTEPSFEDVTFLAFAEHQVYNCMRPFLNLVMV